MRIWKCNWCGKEFIGKPNIPKDIFMVRIYSKAEKLGGSSEVFHICSKCLKELKKKHVQEKGND